MRENEKKKQIVVIIIIRRSRRMTMEQESEVKVIPMAHKLCDIMHDQLMSRYKTIMLLLMTMLQLLTIIQILQQWQLTL